MIKINNRNWKVLYYPEVDKVDPAIKGYTSFEESIIYIKPDMEEAYTDVTLIHEIVHAYIDSYGFSYQEKFNHEQLCEWISSYIFMILDSFKAGKRDLKKQLKAMEKVNKKTGDKDAGIEIELKFDEDKPTRPVRVKKPKSKK